MAKIRPFQALRPVRDKVHLVATRPYYSYKKNVLQAKLEDNPFTLLHIINPEFGKAQKTEANSRERFCIVKEQYASFEKMGILVRDQGAHIYVYRQSSPTGIFTGVIAGADAEEYLADTIKKHEATLSDREKIFTDYLTIVGKNAEPVLISYLGTETIDGILNDVCLARPEYEFTTTDQCKHELWIVSKNNELDILKAFESIPETYIADGHHRSASSVSLYLKEKKSGLNTRHSQFFLAYFVKETDLKILEFQRMVSHLNGLTTTTFLEQLESLGQVTQLSESRKPNKAHDVTICIDGNWWLWTIDSKLIDESHPTESLDTSLLTELILRPILGILDLKTSKDISFIPGITPLEEIESLVTTGKQKIAFCLLPLTFEQVRKVADHGLYMPPKSTYVEPKLRSGLTIMDIHGNH